jgi:Icc-related predicted phosphoesterase
MGKKINFTIIFYLIISFPISNQNLNLTSPYNPYSEIEKYTINTETLKIGIISDSQLIPRAEYSWLEHFTDKFKKALLYFKESNIDVLIFAGDLGDECTDLSWNSWRQAFDEVYLNSNKTPILNVVMGNHDYYCDENAIFIQEKFERFIKEKPFTHKVINGIHFINWSNQNAEMDDRAYQNINWVKKQIEISIKENPKNPIIITTHLNPRNTVYGSVNSGSNNIYNLFKNYNQIINISGHSHYSLLDERSIFQKDFTVIQTQSISYVELDYNRENGSIPKDEYDNTEIASQSNIGLIMEISKEQIEIKRVSFENNKFINDPWIIDLPINKNKFKYTNEIRKQNAIKPYFDFSKDEYKEIDFIYERFWIVKFKQAIHPNWVYNYKLIFSNENVNYSFLYYSDFYQIPEFRKEIIRLKIPERLNNGIYNVTIIAIESFGLESKNNLTGVFEKNLN